MEFKSTTKQVDKLTEHLLIGLSPFFDGLSSALSIYFFMTMLIISSTFFMDVGWGIGTVWLGKNEPRTRNFPPASATKPQTESELCHWVRHFHCNCHFCCCCCCSCCFCWRVFWTQRCDKSGKAASERSVTYVTLWALLPCQVPLETPNE